jgi:hypothetical protein
VYLLVMAPLLVLLNPRRSIETLQTLITTIWLLPMAPFVLSKVQPCFETIETLVVCIWRLAMRVP